MISKNYKIILVLFLSFLLVSLSSSVSGESRNFKIIEWGWGTPTPAYVKEHIQDMEKLPFDGLVLDLKGNQGSSGTAELFSWNVWGAKSLRLEEYQESYEALRLIKFQKFTDNFLRFNATPGNIDWFAPGFSVVISNAKLAAQIAKTCNLKGILLDLEHYGQEPFRYNSQPDREKHSFPDYQKQAKKCGREFMQAINAAYPEVTILLTYGYFLAYSSKKPLEQAAYGLLPAFLDGMLEAASPATLIFDGWEFAYGYKKEEEFQKAYEVMHQLLYERCEVKDAFKQHYRASFGLWLDKGKKWNGTDISKNYFTPQEFESSLRHALRRTDRYVWIYSEKPNWWTNQVPYPYIDALRRARSTESASSLR